MTAQEHLVGLGISISGLEQHQIDRIEEVGFWRWMGEVAPCIPLKSSRPNRRSLEYKQRQMAKRVKKTV